MLGPSNVVLFVVCVLMPCGLEGKQWHPLEVPSPLTSYTECGLRHRGYLCDPDNLLQPLERETLASILLNFSVGLPCFCGNCRSSSSTKRFHVALLVVEDIYRPNTTSIMFNEGIARYRDFADTVRVHWDISTCNGNDALILIVKKRYSFQYQTFLSFGRMGQHWFSNWCVRHMERESSIGHRSVYRRAGIVMTTLKRNLLRQCNCGHCSFTDKWYRMIAWILAGVFLLSSVSFFGRRIWSHHTTIGMVPMRSSLFTRPYSTRSNWGARSHHQVSLVLPPRVSAARERIQDTLEAEDRVVARCPSSTVAYRSADNTLIEFNPPSYTSLSDPPPYPGASKPPTNSTCLSINNPCLPEDPPPYTPPSDSQQESTEPKNN